jgi:hypothetical protein
VVLYGVKLDANAIEFGLLHGSTDFFGASCRNRKIAVSRAHVYSLNIKVP